MRSLGFRPRLAAWLPAAALSLATACDVPTDAPVWDTLWSLTVGDISLSPADLFPDDVDLTGTTFGFPVPPTLSTSPLETFCPDCEEGSSAHAGLDGEIFIASFISGAIREADLSGGHIRVTLEHEWTFDPLRPAGDETGRIVITAEDGSDPPRILAEAILDGADTDFPSRVVRTVELTSGPTPFTGGGRVRVRLTGPAGPSAGPLETQAPLRVALTDGVLEANWVEFTVRDEETVSDAVTLDLTDVDPDVDEHVLAGGFILKTSNTLDAGLAGTLEVLPVGSTLITKTLAIPKGDETQLVELTAEEVHEVVGARVIVRARGRIEGAAGGILRVEPDDRLQGKLDLQVAVRVGS